VRRVLRPLAVPVIAVLAIGVVVFNFSRVLLATHGTSASVIALLAASAVLFGATSLSARKRPVSGLGVVAATGGLVVLSGMLAIAAMDAEHAKETAGSEGEGIGAPQYVVKAFDLGFRDKRAEVPAGKAVIGYVNEGKQAHTLVIEGKPGFKLQVGAEGEEDKAAVELEPGSYVMFCDIPGHRAGGMEGELVAVEGLAGDAEAKPDSGTPEEHAAAQGSETPRGTAPAAGGQGAGAAGELEVGARDLTLEPSQLSAKAGPLRISYRNESDLIHTLLVQGRRDLRLEVRKRGDVAQGAVTLPAGSYVLYCDLHAGMDARLVLA
ncbi:MAG: hypothetical protein ACRDV9_01515, partial [Acidimicrobiia bacterium]